MHIVKTILSTLLYALITIACLDGFLRVSCVLPTYDIKSDSIIGSIITPNRSFVNFNEGFSIRQSSQDGYYGTSYSRIKREDSTRICLAGDSYVEALQVLERHHFGSILREQCVNDGIKAEMLNFGRSGFDLNDTYCYYHNFINFFNPDLTLIFLSAGDLIDNSHMHPYSPRANLIGEKIVIDTSFKHSKYYKKKIKVEKIRQASVIIESSWRARQLIQNDAYLTILFDKLYSPNNKVESNNEINDLKLSELNKAILSELSLNKCIFVLHSETSNYKYEKLLNEAKSYFNNHNIKYINLQPYFDSLRKINKPVTYWPTTKRTGHFNQFGHEVIANILHKELILNNLMPFKNNF